MRVERHRRDPTRRGLLAGGLAGLALGGAAASPEPIRLRRGINLWPWFSLTREYPPPRIDYGWPAFQAQRPVPSLRDLSRLASAGFDFARLPVDPGPFLAFQGERRAMLMASLDAALEAIRAAGLSVVLNLQANAATHHYNPGNLYGAPDAPLLPAYRDLVGELARRLASLEPATAALEPVNEPPHACGAAAWDAIQSSLLAAARLEAPGLTLVATGACGGLIEGLTALDPARLAAFRPLLYSLHFYEPYLFSHQGAPWMREPVYRALNAVPWPASAGALDATLAAVRIRLRADTATPQAERDAAYALTERKLAEYFAAAPDRRFVDRRLQDVCDWSARHGVPPGAVLMGEFGALRSDRRYVAAAAPDRARYIRDVRASVEAAGFTWAYWNLFDGFGLLDDDTREPDLDILVALGLG